MSLLWWFPPTVIGVWLACVLSPRTDFAVARGLFCLSLGAGLGLGVTALLSLAWLTFVPWSYSAYFVLEFVSAALLSISLGIRLWRYRSSNRRAGREDALSRNSFPILRVALITLIVLAGLSFAAESYRHPHGGWDAWAIWNLRARFLFRTTEDWQDMYGMLAEWTHPDYPLLLPASIVRAWSVSEAESTVVPSVIAGLFTFGTLLLVVSSVLVHRGEKQGYLAGFALLGTGFFLQHGASQFADIQFAFFLVATVSLFYWYDVTGRVSSGTVVLAGLTTGCALWTKNEGALFLVALSSVRLVLTWRVGAWVSYVRETVWFWLTLLAFIGSFLLFKLAVAPGNDVVNAAMLTEASQRLFDVSRYVKVASESAIHFLTFGNGIVFALAMYLYLSAIQSRLRIEPTLVAAAGVVALMLAGYFAVYIVTPRDLDWHINTSLDRLIFQLWPTIVMLVFLLLAPGEIASRGVTTVAEDGQPSVSR